MTTNLYEDLCMLHLKMIYLQLQHLMSLSLPMIAQSRNGEDKFVPLNFIFC